MKVGVYDMSGNRISEVDLPPLFETTVREDLIRRAVLAEQSWRRQPYGTDKLAGMRTSAHYHGRRRARFTMIAREMARIPRIHGRGAQYTPLYMEARVVPQARKGRRAHPPKPEKKWEQKINKKEYLKALCSALAACARLEFVKQRGHKFEGEVPIVVSEEIENVKSTKQIVELLKKLNLEAELKRGKKKKVRAGKGKMRGRRYKKKKSILFIFSKDCPAMKAARNIAGADVAVVDELTVEQLAPGAHPGRLVVISLSALQKLEELYGDTT